MRNLYCFLLLIWFPFGVFSQKFFTECPEPLLPIRDRNLPERFRYVCWDMTHLGKTLATAPLRFEARRGQEVELVLPLPDGSLQHFRIVESPIMPPALQEKYPDIRTYTGIGVEDPTASLKCELTPRGFSAMILSARHDPVFVDPISSDRNDGIVYFKSDLKRPKENWTCAVEDSPLPIERFEGTAPALTGDCLLRRYRLALACTGEYAQFHGGTKARALAAMITTLNRVNGVYERDLGITMELVPNNDTLIFLNPDTDGYSNSNLSAMLSQNVNKCNTLIGPEHYDIGHVFATGSGGVAGLGVVCNNNTKARGVTGRSEPVGDAFDIDYVAHEMGHQFGANHTHNNNCSRNSLTAVEPGSGSTIMGYAGICPPNVQAHSDDYFHAISLQEIHQYTVLGPGNGCAHKVDLGNHRPTVTPAEGKVTYTIPRATPFVLTAEGLDANGDALTYCWEQMNPQTAPMPPQPSNAVGPMFRSLKPTASPERYFPALESLLDNAINPWERLPAVGRTMRFRVTARDNYPGGGCTASAEVNITVASQSGPFAVLEPNAPTVWYAGSQQTVRWEVANTHTAPVNCSEVIILLSTDGGWTYPYLLAGPVPNNGETQIEVPLLVSDSCRIRVQAVDNIFFDISDRNFRIERPPVPTFLLSADAPSEVQRCVGDSLVFWVRTLSVAGFSENIALYLEGLPPGAIASSWSNPFPVGDSVRIVLNYLKTPGQYTLVLRGVSDTLVREQAISLRVVEGVPQAPTLLAPVDGQSEVVPNVSFQWTPVDNASHYRIQVSRSPAFLPEQIVREAAVPYAQASGGFWQPGTVYYWRVRAENACGQSAYSSTGAFQIAQKQCDIVFRSEDVPVLIPSTRTSVVSASLLVTDARPLADVDVWVNIRHEWVGDLQASLIGPTGSRVLLFDRPGVPSSTTGCSKDDILVTFDDEAVQTANDFEKMCKAQSPAIEGVFRPIEALARFHSRPAFGSWRLEVRDLAEEDGGAIEGWALRCCLWDTIRKATLLRKQPLMLAAGQMAPIDSSLLQADPAGHSPESLQFTLLSLPQHGQLLHNGQVLTVGSVFTQADVDAGRIAYANNGGIAVQDAFAFDVLNVATSQWLHYEVFPIQIAQNDLIVSLEVLDSLHCHNGATARLRATVQGGKPPYRYELAPSGIIQGDEVFKNLGSGTYFVVVTDGWGFTAVSPSVEVLNPPPIIVHLSTTTDTILVEVSGGIPPYRYRLGENAYQEEPLFPDLPNGTYSVEVKDAKGCTAMAEVIVYVGPLAVLQVRTTPVSCFGSSDGTAQVTAGGGSPPYSYSLNGTDFQFSSFFSALSAGQYTAIVQDKHGAMAEQTFIVEEPPPLEINAVSVLNRIEVTASGGTGPLAYRLNGSAFQTQPVFKGVNNGEYTVTVRDAKGCTAEAVVLVDVPPFRLLHISVDGEIRCAGQTVRVFVSATGGVPPYSYSLDGALFQPDSVWEAVEAGAHVIVLRDDAGNQIASDTFYIHGPTPLTAEVTVVGPNASVSVSGGTPPYRFAWDGDSWTADSTLSRLSNGRHVVVVADANECMDTVAFEVFYVPMVALLTRTFPACAGGSDGAFEIEILGGVPPFACDGVQLSTNRCFRNQLSAGTYIVTLTDALGDTLLVTVTLDDPPALVISAAAVSNTLTANASGGTGPLEYSLDGLHFQPSPVFSNLPDGVYTVTVRDANGCTAVSAPVEIITVHTQTPGYVAQVHLYPNPSTGNFWIQMTPQAVEAWQLSLYDLCGQLVWQSSYSSEGEAPWEVRLPALPAGTYLIYGVSRQRQFFARIILTEVR